ncbi:gluconolaconase [Candidatus Poribacteria bacterium]|nr:gluconolaconase [Candidatus Poribacteria bacterium]
MDPRLIANYDCVTGENPLWHPLEKRVYWTDIPTGRMFRYEPATGEHEQCYEGPKVGGFTVQPDGALLLFMARGAVALWRDGDLTTVIEEIPEERESRFNDVIADPAGRVFCGTMPSPGRLGSLYRLDLDGSITPVAEGVRCSNGMAFTADHTTMYHTDSGVRRIYAYDYDAATGGLSGRRVIVETPDGDGVPDGMTLDAAGDMWSARWDGYRLHKYTAAGAELKGIDFPTRKVSSVTFGGADYTDMYVTTAGGDDKAANGEFAGGLFHLNIGVKGVPEFYSRVAE